MAPPTHDTLVIIPAWNEADVLSGVLQEVLETVGSFADVVVVSDGSTDGTADIARSVGVPVLDLSINLGVGGAMRAGYLYAQRQGYTYTVQLDADGQHAPEEITSLLHEAEEAGADVVIGARFAGKGGLLGPRPALVGDAAVVLHSVQGVRDPADRHDFRFQTLGAAGYRTFSPESIRPSTSATP